LNLGRGKDPGSEIRDPEKKSSRIWIPDPQGKKAPDPGSGSATLINTTVGAGAASRYGSGSDQKDAAPCGSGSATLVVIIAEILYRTSIWCGIESFDYGKYEITGTCS
jgi:hypothetical protein